MTDVPGFFAAFAAGLASFLSPCVLPLVPIYLSFITGETIASLTAGTRGSPNGEAAIEPEKAGWRGKNRLAILSRTLFFVAGFTLVFVALAIAFGGGMRFVGKGANAIVSRIGGAIVVVLAANLVFDFIPFLRMERRVSAKGGTRKRTGNDRDESRAPGAASAILFGMAFAAGWTPCVGPILSSILLFAASDGNVPRAAALLVAYSAGLGVPFILAGLFLDRVRPALDFFRKRATAVKIVSAAILLAFAIPMLLGGFAPFSIALQKAGYAIESLAAGESAWWGPAARAVSSWLRFTGL